MITEETSIELLRCLEDLFLYTSGNTSATKTITDFSNVLKKCESVIVQANNELSQ